MLKITPKLLRDAKAGNYIDFLGILRSLIQPGNKFVKESILITSEVPMLDISFYQGTADFNKMKTNGISGVIIRAGQNSWIDTKSKEFMTNATNSGMPFGSYWFYDSRKSPKDQAAKWKEALGDFDTKLLCWTDYEENYGGAYSGWKNLYNFLEECKRLMPNRKFGIYTGYYYWLAHSPLLAGELNYFTKYPLWLAWYTSDPSIVRIPKPWTKVTIWQKTAKEDGTKYGVGSLNVDYDSFLGTQDEFNSYFGISGNNTTPEPPPVTPPVEPPPVTPPSTPKAKLYRIVWDDENPDYNYKSRTQMKGWKYKRMTPAVMRYYPTMKETGKAGDFRVDISAWKNFFLGLNGGDKQKFNYWTGTQTAQFNKTGWPLIAYITFSGNILEGEVVGKWLKFKTLKVNDLNFAKGKTIRTHPQYIHSFHCVSYKNKKTVHILNTGTQRKEIYFPLITKEGYAYIPLRHVKPL